MSASNSTNLLFSTCTSHRRMAQVINNNNNIDEWKPCLDSPPSPLHMTNIFNENNQNSSMLMKCSMTCSQRNSNYGKNSLMLNSEKMPLSNLDAAGISQHVRQANSMTSSLTNKNNSPIKSNNNNNNHCVGFCVKLYLCNSLFIFLIFLALLLGYWISLDGLKSLNKNLDSKNNQTFNKSRTSPKLVAPPTSHFVLLGGSPKNGKFSSKNGNFLKKNLLKNYSQQNNGTISITTLATTTINNNYAIFNNTFFSKNSIINSLLDVFPPQDEISSNDVLNSAHWHSLQNFVENSDNLASNPSNVEQMLIPLPKNVLPIHYDLQLDFSEFDSKQFRGNVTILLESFGNSTNDELIFHAASNIFIHKIRLQQNEQLINIKSVKRLYQRSLVRIVLNERLKPTWYKLSIEFRTKICQFSQVEGTHCIYASENNSEQNNKNSSNNNKIIGFVTKFEPNFARTFIPGWDEPRIKTTFNVSIRTRSIQPLTILTNSAKIKEEKNEQIKNEFCLTNFETTPKMSLYLLAFAIGPFAALEMRTNRNMPLKIWTESENLFAAHFAANFSPIIFDRIEKEFGINYPLTKMDFVIVSNYPVGGMENWGLIIFHANTILYANSIQPKKSINSGDVFVVEEDESAVDEQSLSVDRRFEQYRIEKLISHEIIHQWFGNLVTMFDWEELWLSEGFATYFVYDFLNAHHSHLTENEYYMRLNDLFDKQRPTSRRTALVHALHDVEDLEEMFGGDLYTKGAIMVKLIKDLIGSVEFRAGISRFLKKFAFEAVDRRSLWNCLPTFAEHGAEPQKLAEIFNTWLLNEGMPEVIISRNYADQSLRVTQRIVNPNRYVIYLNEESELNNNNNNIKKNYPKKRQKRFINSKMKNEYEKENHNIEDEKVDVLEKGIITWWLSTEPTIPNINLTDSNSTLTPENIQERIKSNLKQDEENIKEENEEDIMDPNFLINHLPEFFKENNLKIRTTMTTTTNSFEDLSTNKDFFKTFNETEATNELTTNSLQTTTKKEESLNFENLLITKKIIKNIQIPNKIDIFQKRESSSINLKNQNSGSRRRGSKRRYQINGQTNNQNKFSKLSKKHQRLETQTRLETIRVWLPNENNQKMEEDLEKHSASRRTAALADSERSGGYTREKIFEPLWWIPFSYSFGARNSTSGETAREFWLQNRTLRFVDVGMSRSEYFLANPHWIYPYRVNYDVENWKMIISQLHLNPITIPLMSRMQLLVDANIYLKQSAFPHLYVQLLSYLRDEQDLGVLLVGLDAIHSLLDLFGGTRLAGYLIVHFVPILEQLDQMLISSGTGAQNAELAALWLLKPLRLLKLYQLRCLANLASCAQNQQVTKWLAFPTALDSENHQQIAAICHHLYSQGGNAEVAILMGLLRQKSNSQWAVLVQLGASCVRDETLLRDLVSKIVRTRNARVFLAILKNSYTLRYNRKFRELFWCEIATLTLNERQMLFAVNTGASDKIAQQFIHSSRTLEELHQIKQLLPDWPDTLQWHFKYVERRISWLNGNATNQILEFLTMAKI